MPRRTCCLWNQTIKNTIEKQNRKLEERCTLLSHCLKPLRTQGCFCSCVVGGHSYEQPLHFIRNKADRKACVVRDQHLEKTWMFLLGMWAHTCNNNTWNPETRASWFQGAHEVNSKFQDSLSYETLFQNKKKCSNSVFIFVRDTRHRAQGRSLDEGKYKVGLMGNNGFREPCTAAVGQLLTWGCLRQPVL